MVNINYYAVAYLSMLIVPLLASEKQVNFEEYWIISWKGSARWLVQYDWLGTVCFLNLKKFKPNLT